MSQTSTSIHRALTQQAQYAVDSLFAAVDGAVAVVAATADGFDIAHAGRQVVEPGRLAAIVSSFSALGNAASLETGIGTPRCLVVESTRGRLVVRCMHVGESAIVVVILADASVSLGFVWSHLSAAERLLNAA